MVVNRSCCNFLFLKFNGLYQCFFLLGYISHLGADFLTDHGIEFLYPSPKNYSFRLMKTGGFTEKLLRMALGLGLALISILFVHQEVVKLLKQF